MTKLIVFWSIACAIALYQLIRYLAGSKKHRKLLTNLMFIPFFIIAFFAFEFPQGRNGPGPTNETSYVKEQDGYYLFSNGTAASVDDVYISDETKQNERVIVQTREGYKHANRDIVIDGQTYRLLKNINAVYADYSWYDNFVFFGSLTVLAVFDILTMIKNMMDYYKKGDESSDENEEKTQS